MINEDDIEELRRRRRKDRFSYYRDNIFYFGTLRTSEHHRADAFKSKAEFGENPIIRGSDWGNESNECGQN